MNLECHESLSNSAFKFNLRRYCKAAAPGARVARAADALTLSNPAATLETSSWPRRLRLRVGKFPG